ncbi:MAG: TVP38/TMEM64 family protein [Clostridia bacterium]|nr:TVP38/TMEM64 family protein [Clostridia bacterium]
MRIEDLKKIDKKRFAMKHSATVCFLMALFLILVTYALTFPAVQKSLNEIEQWFVSLEYFIAGFNELIAFFIIIILFIFKSFLPVIPFSVLFISSGMVFPAPVAVLVNALGFALLVSVKFLWGRKFGGGKAFKILKKYEPVVKFMDFNGSGNKWMLALLRFIPFMPVGPVSRAYGTTEIKFLPYVGLSVVGFLPRLIAWSVIGFSIFDPFTPGFVVPFIVLLVISGISLLIYNSLSE